MNTCSSNKCTTPNARLTDDNRMQCVWCSRQFHRGCLIQYNTPILFEQSSNIECQHCNPELPLVLTDSNKQPFTIVNLGTHISSELEHNKCTTDGSFVFPIGYTVTRRIQSYMSNHNTTITCEILCVDENYLSPHIEECGTKDCYLFRITYHDDPNNPVEVMDSPRFIGAQLKERYLASENIESYKFGKQPPVVGKVLFGLDNVYVQYLIHLHVPGVLDVSDASLDDMMTKMYEIGIIEKCTAPRERPKSSFLFTIPEHRSDNPFDPQHYLFKC